MCQQIHIYVHLQFPYSDIQRTCNSIQWCIAHMEMVTYKYMERSVNMHILTSVVGRGISFHARSLSFLCKKSFLNFLNSFPINYAIRYYADRHAWQATLQRNSMSQLVDQIRSSTYLRLTIQGDTIWQLRKQFPHQKLRTYNWNSQKFVHVQNS